MTQTTFLPIADLTDRAGLIYCYAGEHAYGCGDDRTVGYSVAHQAAILSRLGEEFLRDYGPANEWNGSPIDFGELIHWAHSMGS